MESVLEWVRTVVFYLILISAIMHILPDKQYTKYVQLFVGLLLIIITMEPIIQFLDQDNLVDTMYQKAVYWQEIESQKDMIEKLNEQERQAIMGAYETQLSNHLTQWFEQKGYTVNEINVQIKEDGIRTIQADIQAVEEKNLEKKQRDTRELRKTLAEIYEVSIGEVSLKVR